jgi:hypothetical protein
MMVVRHPTPSFQHKNNSIKLESSLWDCPGNLVKNLVYGIWDLIIVVVL